MSRFSYIAPTNSTDELSSCSGTKKFSPSSARKSWYRCSYSQRKQCFFFRPTNELVELQPVSALNPINVCTPGLTQWNNWLVSIWRVVLCSCTKERSCRDLYGKYRRNYGNICAWWIDHNAVCAISWSLVQVQKQPCVCFLLGCLQLVDNGFPNSHASPTIDTVKPPALLSTDVELALCIYNFLCKLRTQPVINKELDLFSLIFILT